ncbi:Protein of unknown function [Pyronema omphalodes CBS 100304]|uniref:Uncharacterized protein n=1 Tax=Pyronema omphalodes (strain CBS 100304) TaxID=1076935 RepID=U4L4B2_PYROM|nr:Protein of unknown function [Pyronema omphalodes CBS 100304]
MADSHYFRYLGVQLGFIKHWRFVL